MFFSATDWMFVCLSACQPNFIQLWNARITENKCYSISRCEQSPTGSIWISKDWFVKYKRKFPTEALCPLSRRTKTEALSINFALFWINQWTVVSSSKLVVFATDLLKCKCVFVHPCPHLRMGVYTLWGKIYMFLQFNCSIKTLAV